MIEDAKSGWLRFEINSSRIASSQASPSEYGGALLAGGGWGNINSAHPTLRMQPWNTQHVQGNFADG